MNEEEAKKKYFERHKRLGTNKNLSSAHYYINNILNSAIADSIIDTESEENAIIFGSIINEGNKILPTLDEFVGVDEITPDSTKGKIDHYYTLIDHQNFLNIKFGMYLNENHLNQIIKYTDYTPGKPTKGEG